MEAPTNMTEWEVKMHEFEDQWRRQSVLNYFFVGIMGFLGVFGSMANTVVIASLLIIPELHQIQYAFVGNLALADLVVTSVIIPINIAITLKGPDLFLRYPWFCELDGTICASACAGSMWCIAAIAMERYACICHYGTYRQLFTPFRTGIMIVLLWVIGHTIHMPVFVGWGKTIYAEDLHVCTADVGVWSYSVFYGVVAILTPMCISFFAYFRIYLRIRISRAGRKALTGGKSKVSSGKSLVGVEKGKEESTKHKQVESLKEEIRLVKALFKVFLVFLGSWIWIATFAVARNWVVFPKWYGYMALTLAHGSSATNSVTYFWMTDLMSTAKKGYARLFRRVRARIGIWPHDHIVTVSGAEHSISRAPATQIPHLAME